MCADRGYRSLTFLPTIIRMIWSSAIAGEVTTQYILRYVPDVGPSSAKQFRRITVVVPDLPGVKIRFRKGYYPYAP